MLPGPSPVRRRARSGVGGAAGAVTVALVLTGCVSAVQVPVAPSAADPVCARVVLSLPQELAGRERRQTTSQGTAAWTADPAEGAITLRCGVEPLPPTTEQCLTITDDAGTSVDWVTVPGDAGTGTPWTFTTYGRLPAVELTVPASVAPEQSQSFLVDLGLAVSATEQVRACL